MSEPVFTAYTSSARDRLLPLVKMFYAHEQVVFDEKIIFSVLEELAAPHPPGFLYFIEQDGKTAGYLLVTSCFSMEFGGRFLLLDELFLLEEFRGKGVGKKVVQFTESLCEKTGCSHLRLEVHHANHRALATYHKAGFLSHGRDYLTKSIDSGKN
ncbi:MAG: GNAT family N-acetyltransferase [Verrucomicrobiota bacterium]|nr:GNAT family N-acetyltransferase [Verrucomicrobiota bacterium]